MFLSVFVENEIMQIYAHITGDAHCKINKFFFFSFWEPVFMEQKSLQFITFFCHYFFIVLLQGKRIYKHIESQTNSVQVSTMSEEIQDASNVEKRTLNAAAEETESSKRIKLETPQESKPATEIAPTEAASTTPTVITKYVIVPVATIGCGKTTVALTLQTLFPTWGHVQNDNIQDAKSNPHALERSALEILAGLNTGDNKIQLPKDVVIVDRNNHKYIERRTLMQNIDRLKKEYLPNDANLRYKIKYIALNFLNLSNFQKQNQSQSQPDKFDIGDVSESDFVRKDEKLWQITHKRIIDRGVNHQSIQIPANGDTSDIDYIMKGFINRFQYIDPSTDPDSWFDLIIELDPYGENSSRTNIDTIISQLNVKMPDIFSTAVTKQQQQQPQLQFPTLQEIDAAFDKALQYRPTFRKIFDNPIRNNNITSPTAKGVQETDVGITKYISPDLMAFAGTLKQRYNDFLVNEIDLDGNVIHLLDEGLPNKHDRKREKRANNNTSNNANAVGNNNGNNNGTNDPPAQPEEVKPKPEQPKLELSESHKKRLIEILGDEDFHNLVNVYQLSKTMATTKKFTDKIERTELHQLIREAFGGKIESITNGDNTMKFGIANNRTRKQRGANTNNGNKQQANPDPYGLGPKKEFLHFVVYKENKETMEVANLISKFLRTSNKLVRYAGTKDRRGITVQAACISRIGVEKVNGLNKSLRGVRLGSFKYSDDSLTLGDLQGNEFVITIRDVRSLNESKTIEEIIETNFESLKEKGFLNYFGMQRFGTFSVSTHEIGKEILLGNWAKACELLLSNQELVLPDSVKAREIWESTKNPSLALREMPRKCIAEVSILKSLHEESQRTNSQNFTTSQFFQALMKIPRNLRIMYGHAYQSYVWNSVASRRFELFGLTIVPGDLVIVEQNTAELVQKQEQQQDTDAEVDELEGGEDIRNDTFIRARPVTAEEIEQGKFSVYDVVLPTPGFDIIYPENPDIKQVYVEVMAKDGLDPMKMTRNVREFSFAGSYRHLLNKPSHLEYHLRHYDDPIQDLVVNDLDLLRKFKQEQRAKSLTDAGTAADATTATASTASANVNPEKAPESSYKFDELKQILPDSAGGKGTRTAVILKMRLPTSAYATMALREVMKIDTNRRSETFNVKTF